MKRVNEQVLSWGRRGRKSLRGILGCVSLLSFLALPSQAGAGIIRNVGFASVSPALAAAGPRSATRSPGSGNSRPRSKVLHPCRGEGKCK